MKIDVNFMRTTFLILAMAALATTAAGKGSITPGAMTSWKIVSNPAAGESERYAAAEFQRLFKGLTGTELPVAETAPAGSGAVFIGPDAVAGAGQTAGWPALGEEGLRLEVRANAVLIDGGRPRGTLYGVYEFFEELCGVRFLTFDHTYYPPDGATRRIPLGARTVEPTFAFRWSYYGETSRHPDFGARLRNNTISDDPKLGGRTGYRLVSHNVAYLVPPAKFGKDHPEYYAMVRGQRRIEGGGGGPQLCVSNPELVGVVAGAILEEIRKDPKARNINIAQMDNENYCTCPQCAAIDAREESHAGAMLAFVNAVAERVEKTHPEVLISTYAYQFTRKPPKTIQPRDNVLIQLCSIECCNLHSIDDPGCPLNREFCADTEGWNKIAKHLLIWHYDTNFKSYELPFPNLRSIGPSVAFFASHHGQGVFMEAAGNALSAELSDLRNYVISRCLWKPGRDSWKEAQEFCRLHYAEAAGPILAYLKYYYDLVGHAGVHPTCFPTESAIGITPESSRRILGYFQEALSLARSDEVRERVEKASVCAYRAGLSAASINFTCRDGMCRPGLEGLPADLLEHYTALCAKFGVSMEGEELHTAQYLKEMRGLFGGLKAVQLENEFWRLTVLPESNGKIVEMIHKPTGRNIIHAMRAFNRFRYEVWMKQGDGPTLENVLPFEAQAGPQSVRLSLTTQDGSRLERRVTLAGEAIQFETTLTAGAPRPFDVLEHPEFDTASTATDPASLGIYIKKPDWSQANRSWSKSMSGEQHDGLVKDALAGGAIAYFNFAAKFGVEERFDPEQLRSVGLYLSGSRQQINFELSPKLVTLDKGGRATYSYELRYLKEPPAR